MARDLRWDPHWGRYRDGASGRLLSRAQQVRLRDDLADAFAERFRDLTGRAFAGEVTGSAFEVEFRALLAEATSSGYAFGTGGVLDASDADTVARMLERQEPFSAEFIADVIDAVEGATEEPSPRQGRLTARSRLYAGQTVEAYERGQARAAGRVAAEIAREEDAAGVVIDSLGPNLPRYPGDQNQVCGSMCRCRWVIVAHPDRWECTWTLNPSAQHCDTCRANARQYDPLIRPYRGEGGTT